LNTVKTGNRVSFVPTFDPAPATMTACNWIAGYFLRDAFDGVDPEYQIEGSGDCAESPRCAKLTALSIWPAADCNLMATFPGLFDETRQNVRGLLSILKPTDVNYQNLLNKPALAL